MSAQGLALALFGRRKGWKLTSDLARLEHEMSDTALLVIDAQESFRQRQSWYEVDSPTYLARQQALIDGARALGHPVIQVLHAESEGIFSLASGFVKPLAELSYTPDFRSSRPAIPP